MIQTLEKYRILEQLGEGPLGRVYMAADDAQGRTVAIRTIGDGIKWNPADKLRFRREYESIAALQHPKIATIYDLVEEEELIHIVMEFLPGKNLRTLMDEKAEISEEAKLSVIAQVVEGLQHAHKCGILHRDVRPSNIHVAPDGTAKILEFGLGFLLSPYLARPSVRWGAPIYLSPEQVQGKNCDDHSEIFSTGVVFWEFITGVHPFHDRDGNKALDNILYAAPSPGPEEFPDIPSQVRSILSTCLAKDPADRYESMAKLADDCREALEEVVEDSEFMQIELQMALPRLKKAIGSPGAPTQLVTLLKDIQSLVNCEKKPDYGSLNRLMSALSSQYPTIKAASRAPAPIKLVTGLPENEEEAGPSANMSVTAGAQKASLQDNPAEGVDQAVRSETEASIPLWENAELQQAVAAIHMENRSTGPFKDDPHTELPVPQAPDIPESVPEIHEVPSVSTPAVEMTAPEHRASEIQAREDSDALPVDGSEVLPSVVPSVGDQDTEAGAGPRQADSQPDGPVNEGGWKLGSATEVLKNYRKNIILGGMWAAVGILTLSFTLSIIAEYRIRNRTSMNSATSSGIKPGRQEQHSGAGSPASGTVQRPGTDDPGEKPDADVMLQEAQKLANQGRIEEGKALIRRILESYPTYVPAITALRQFKVESYARVLDQEEKQVKSLLSSASGLIRAGKLQAALAKLDQAERFRPDSPELAALRRQWEAKYSEVSQDQALNEAAQLEDTRRQKADQVWSRQVEYLYRQGKYSEAQSLMDRWSSESPGSLQAREWRARNGETQRILQEFNSAFNEKRYREAVDALARLELMNPTEPNLAELRRQVESRKAGAKAVLTVYRLGEPATLTLDGRALGTNGEAENESISIGSHTLAVDGKDGSHITINHEFIDGQKVAFVYDTVQPALRVMGDRDRELVSNRKKREQVNHFTVEHSHGVFRGSCKGELLVSFSEVEYRPSAGSHGFRLPFRDLRLRTRGKSIELLVASEGKEFQSFKIQDESEGNNLRLLWDNLEALGK